MHNIAAIEGETLVFLHFPKSDSVKNRAPGGSNLPSGDVHAFAL